ncbi:MAG: nicotinate phosphoribosyltransferase [Candidatus Saccharimonadales bacterium]
MNETTTHLSQGLDYYKLTMGDVIYEHHPNEQVTFTLKNRSETDQLSRYVSVETLQARLDGIAQRGFNAEEIAYYAGLQAQDGTARFTQQYLDHLADLQLPLVDVTQNTDTNELQVQVAGAWQDVSLWETVVMSEINELYYQQLIEQQGLDITTIYGEGERRLSDKIARIRARPDIQLADFGTRRRFSAHWHEHVIKRLAAECPDNLTGTSNPWFAYRYNLMPIGTFAHEMPMVYAGLADSNGEDPLSGHHQMLDDWQQHYNGDLSVALSDTFTSEFFFSDFTQQQAQQWAGLRHDSGSPIDFGEQVIEFYREHGVDPLTKTIVFSDGLNIDAIETIAGHFGGRIKILFGWGTNLMNDMGLPANNFVMKATHVNGVDTVKLSDDNGKHTGPEALVQRYQSLVRRRIGTSAMNAAAIQTS